MPEDYKGKYLKNGGYTTFQPRKWTEQEIEWATSLKDKGYKTKDIAYSLGRDKTQVSIKLKRLAKANKKYNDPHRKEKYQTNDLFFDLINPKSVLDVYAGETSYYKKHILNNLVTNDINDSYETTFNLDALKLCCLQYYEGNKYDLIDLDPFGSAFDCIDLSIKMANKGFIVTFGEMGHKRFKRLDYVKRYGINDLNSFTVQKMIEYVVNVGANNKKSLQPVYVKNWRNISRVYFKISKLKITSQWDKK